MFNIDIKKRFDEILEINTFKRIDNDHILDLYLGKDCNYRDTLLLISENEPPTIYSVQIININIWQRDDTKWMINFSLVNNDFKDLFCHFCEDIVKSSRYLKNKMHGSNFICERYIKWQNMLSKYKHGLLSESEIKGLIGELYFLKNVLIPENGEENAINAWIGPEKTFQDFVFENYWYEVKTTISGADSVKISSIEQLDADKTGELVIIFLDKTSYIDKGKISLNIIYNQIIESIKDYNLKTRFNDTLLILGFYERPEYDEYIYKFSGLIKYIINNDFPCIRRIKIPGSVINAKYELSLLSINKFRKE